MTPLALLLGLSAADPSPTAEVKALLEAGKSAEAAAALETLPEAMRPRFEGLLALEEGDPARAAEAFERALAAGETEDPALRLHLAHAYLLSDRPEAALEAVEAASAVASTLVAQPLIEARARRALGDKAGAYAVLARAAGTFADEIRPHLELVALAEEVGLRHHARAFTARLLEVGPDALEPDAALAVFHLLVQDPEALPLLEAVARRFPADPELTSRLAHAYARAEKWYASARLFEEATRLGGTFAFEAADQYRMAGRFRDALRLNARVEDDRRSAQRLTILFEAGAYARVVALTDPPQDPASIYRRAYAHYNLGHRSRAATLARSLLEVEEEEAAAYQASARALLEAMGLTEEPE